MICGFSPGVAGLLGVPLPPAECDSGVRLLRCDPTELALDFLEWPLTDNLLGRSFFLPFSPFSGVLRKANNSSSFMFFSFFLVPPGGVMVPLACVVSAVVGRLSCERYAFSAFILLRLLGTETELAMRLVFVVVGGGAR